MAEISNKGLIPLLETVQLTELNYLIETRESELNCFELPTLLKNSTGQYFLSWGVPPLWHSRVVQLTSVQSVLDAVALWIAEKYRYNERLGDALEETQIRKLIPKTDQELVALVLDWEKSEYVFEDLDSRVFILILEKTGLIRCRFPTQDQK